MTSRPKTQTAGPPTLTPTSSTPPTTPMTTISNPSQRLGVLASSSPCSGRASRLRHHSPQKAQLLNFAPFASLFASLPLERKEDEESCRAVAPLRERRGGLRVLRRASGSASSRPSTGGDGRCAGDGGGGERERAAAEGGEGDRGDQGEDRCAGGEDRGFWAAGQGRLDPGGDSEALDVGEGPRRTAAGEGQLVPDPRGRRREAGERVEVVP
mmetsp:Transcript_10657/g.32053  ORF Transcript_10657/g.32053 Transcript_10657/m.32053 type:complete len:212 (+) Transcript_10657:1218-1853(+)